MASRLEKAKMKEEKNRRRMVKWMLALCTFIFVLGLETVDQAYVEMTEEDTNLMPCIKKIDDDTLQLKVLGQEFEFDSLDIHFPL